MAQTFDLVVLGAGPAGYIAAIRAGQLGLNVACIDGGVGPDGKPSLGGTCLNVGCIPSKALLESSEHFHRCEAELKDLGISTGDVRMDVPAMIARKNKIVRGLASGVTTLFAKNKVVSFAGTGRLLSGMRIEVSPLGGGPIETLEAKNILIATGSLPRDIDHVPTDGTIVVDSSGALDFTAAPEKLGVIGAGGIGLELGSVWHRLGSQVVLLEAMETFLPGADEQIADTAFKEMSRQGLDIRLGARVLSAKIGGDGVQVSYENGDGKHNIEFSKLVVAVGRKPNTQGIDVNEVGLLLDERGYNRAPYIASSARFSRSTLTRGSPMRPSARPLTCAATIARTFSSGNPRALATAGTSAKAVAGEISGSSPEAEVVTRSIGTGLPGFCAASLSMSP